MFKPELLIAGLCPYVMAVGDQQPAIPSEILLHSTSAWDGVPYQAYPKGVPELSVLKITIPPHSRMKWHMHPMPNAAFVVSGQISVEEENRNEKRSFVAGQAIPEAVNTLHRGVTGDQAVVLIVFYAGVEGMPLAESKP